MSASSWGRRSRALVVWVAATLLALVVASVSPAVAQTFTQRPMLGSDLFATDANTDFWINAVAPADVDGDGDLDLAVLGFYVVYHESVEHILVVFRNNGAVGTGWSFAEQRVPLGDVFAGASDLAWGDYDNDGDPDLAVGSEGATVLYRNDAGSLVAAATTPSVLPGYDEASNNTGAYDLRSITWADVDNDGDVDLFLPSVFDRSRFEYSTRLLRNNGDMNGAWRFTETSIAIDSTVHAQSAWADEDGDDDLDLFLTNIDPDTATGFIKRFENVGDGFVGADLLGIRIEHGLADWGDHDADGDLDILVAGHVQEEDGTFATGLRIYRNDGGTYSPISLPLPRPSWLDLHAATWADYDSDGDIDLLATGSFVGDDEIEGESEIYRNVGGGFTALSVKLPAPVSSIDRGGAFTWFDLNNDGDLDYLVAGAYYVPNGNGLVEAQINLFQNGTSAVNQAPSAPSELAMRTGGDGIILDWAEASDDDTPKEALTYDLELRRAGQAFGTSKREPAPGTLGAVNGWKVALPPGSYEWSVRAVDAAYSAGPRSKATLTVPPLCIGFAATKVGTEAADVLQGTSGPDVIHGLGGNDTILGLGGNDRLCGGNGLDTLSGGTGNDKMDGGADLDTASYSASTTAVTASLANNTATGEGSDTFIGIERLTGSSKADTLTGNGVANVLTGLGGNDKLNGAGGNDLLNGGDGNDAMNGGAGTDTCNGGAGSGDTRTACETVTGVP